MCECEETLVARLEQDFKSTLQQQNSLEQWASWLESVVNTVLEPYAGGNQFPKAARQFLLKWSFYRYECVNAFGGKICCKMFCVFVFGQQNKFKFT